jgi:hypothetical protein
MNASTWSSRIGRTLNQNSPTILSAVAIGGIVTTAYLTARAAVKVAKETEGLEMTHQERIKNNWKNFIPAAFSGIATVSCVIGANQIGARRQAAYLGAYTLADAAFREYKDEVLAQLGAVKEAKVGERIAQRKIDENPVSNTQVIITGRGENLCYDSLTGRYFRSDIETIRQAQNEINQRIVGGDMYAAHNEFYELLGMGPTTIGNELGWTLDNFIELVFSSHLSDDGQPCLAIGYSRLPRADYTKF